MAGVDETLGWMSGIRGSQDGPRGAHGGGGRPPRGEHGAGIRPPREHRARRRGAVALTLVALAAVLAGTRTSSGAALVEWLHGFLEFYVGAFALVALSAVVVSGVTAAQRLVPIRFRILAQAAHRATAFMAVGFLVAHIVLKIMEAHASVLDAVLPFVGAHGRVLYIGLGTIASDLLIVVLATGLVRGRFVAGTRPWVWRTVHALAYIMWPVAILHGLLAGRTPAAWVTWSYIVCALAVAVAAAARLPRLLRDRRMVRARKVKVTESGRTATRLDDSSGDLPDEDFWASLREETAPWIGDRR